MKCANVIQWSWLS